MSAPGVLKLNVEAPLDQFELSCAFQVEREVVVLFGASGAGKTSILECIAGFRRPERGRIEIGGRVLFDAASGVCVPVHLRRVGYLSQQPALFPHMTVGENIAYGLHDIAAVEREGRVRSIMERFQIAALSGRRPGKISGGEQQRAALARALVCDPEVLLLDEPLSALDGRLKSVLLELLFDWQRERGVPMLYVTHDPQEAYSLARRLLVVELGRITADGDPRNVLESPVSREQASRAGYENLLEAVVEERHLELGTMTCRIAHDLRLETPLADAQAGDAVTLALRAGDILVATESPRGLSARNLVPGVVELVEERGGMVELSVRCGATLLRVHVTRGARQSLALEAGRAVWLVIKTQSIRYLRG